TDKGITWTSTSAKIASVSSSGLVTGIAEGTAQIRAVSDSNSACYAVCDITVAKQKIPVTGIEMNASPFGTPFEVNIGRTLILSPTVKPDNATNKAIIWTSNDESIAKVANGVVTGVSEGTTTITATTADGGYSASCTVKVTKPTVYVTGIAINAEQLTVNVKETKKLTAAVTPADATDKTITFKSNNNAIASVSADGTVTGVSPGTTLIQAISDTSSGKFIAFCTVTVPKPVVEVTSVKLDKGAVEIVEGKTVPVKAVIKPTNATYKNITWSTSDESIATVSQDGYITAQGVGEAVVSATAVNGVNTVCSVTVLSSDTPAQLKVEDSTVKAGKQVPITVSIAANPGISTFNFDLTYDNTKLYPVSYTKGDVLENVNVVTPLGTQSFKDRSSVRFLCSTADSKNMDSDGDLITVIFQTLEGIEYGDETIGIVPSAFTNQNYEAINLQEDNCTLNITDYIIGDVNNDDTVDLKDSMMLGQYIAGFGVELTPQGRKAAVSIYPDAGDDAETAEPSLNDFQHLFRYLSDWQVELGKK
ncbi:MAG: Ig-like domain-containing protein, partial [Candidatus Ornithomonoglobus sp.]